MTDRLFNLRRLHLDEHGGAVVEDILVLAVALVALTALVIFVKWAITEFNERVEKLADA